jgi:hypothetical protein
MIKITIRECKTQGQVWTSKHRTQNHDAAIGLALKKHFGRNSHFFRNHELSRGIESGGYGQVMKWVGVSQYNSITGRVRIDVEEV